MSNVAIVRLDTITLTKLVTLSVDLFEKEQGRLPVEVRRLMIASRYEYAYLQNRAYGVWGAVNTLHTVGSHAWCSHLIFPFLVEQKSQALAA